MRFAVISVVLLASTAFAQSLTDPGLTTQTWVGGLDRPTGAAIFNTRGDMMVIEKNTGKVKIVRERKVRGTLLDLPVSNDSERGLLGIVLSPDFATNNLVYLYHTASNSDGGSPISNKISRYRYDGSSLVFDKKIIDLPALPGPNHSGGKMAFGPDRNLYAVIGDLNLNNANSNYGGQPVQLTGSILRLNPNGVPPTSNPFHTGTAGQPQNAIYAYGVRNSFGIAFDPVTGDLWDSENGPSDFDEVNRVFPGFNSGWEKIMGPVDRNGGEQPDLVSLGPAAVYSDPKFSWKTPVAPTDLEFMPNSRLGSQYKNDLFVGTTRGGKILRFDLTRTRKSLSLDGGLADLVADNSSSDRFAEQDALIFGSDFGTVTDLFAGPGGMYVVSLTNNTIYRITTTTGLQRPSIVPEPVGICLVLCALIPMFSRELARVFSQTA